MTECIRQPLLFSSVGRKKVAADFTGGTLTSDAGGLLLREVDCRLGLIDRVSECLTDPRDPAKIRHDLRTMLVQRIFGIALGYEDLNDHDTLRHDPLFAVLANKPQVMQPLASSPTLCRLENRVDRKTLARMSAVLVETFIDSFDAPPEELILDFDATDDPVHGKQEGRFFHGYYDHYCFLPLYVFCKDQLLVSYLRPSNIDPARHAWAILDLLVRRFRQVWPGVRIILRGDSGFCRWKMMRWCDRHDVYYVLGISRNPVLERLSAGFLAAAEEMFRQTSLKQRQFHEVGYAAKTWDRERRVIVKAERLVEGPNLRYVVTNLPGTDESGAGYSPARVYDWLYVARGDMENRIKEQQLGLFADRTSCHAFAANQFRLMLSSLAYVLIEHLRRTALRNTELATAQVNTIRLKLFKVAARVVITVRRVMLHLSSAYPLQALFRRLATSVTLTTGPPVANLA